MVEGSPVAVGNLGDVLAPPASTQAGRGGRAFGVRGTFLETGGADTGPRGNAAGLPHCGLGQAMRNIPCLGPWTSASQSLNASGQSTGSGCKAKKVACFLHSQTDAREPRREHRSRLNNHHRVQPRDRQDKPWAWLVIPWHRIGRWGGGQVAYRIAQTGQCAMLYMLFHPYYSLNVAIKSIWRVSVGGRLPGWRHGIPIPRPTWR